MGTAHHATGRVNTAASSAGSAVGDAGLGLGSTLSDAGTAVADAPHQAAAKTRGNPMAAGLIAFGAGLLVSSLDIRSEPEGTRSRRGTENSSGTGHQPADRRRQGNGVRARRNRPRTPWKTSRPPPPTPSRRLRRRAAQRRLRRERNVRGRQGPRPLRLGLRPVPAPPRREDPAGRLGFPEAVIGSRNSRRRTAVWQQITTRNRMPGPRAGSWAWRPAWTSDGSTARSATSV